MREERDEVYFACPKGANKEGRRAYQMSGPAIRIALLNVVYRFSGFRKGGIVGLSIILLISSSPNLKFG
jgi:hypothetical protein